MIKPMLAEDYNPLKINFPVGIMPKIDGVRGFNPDGVLKGRSLKTHENKYITHLLSKDIFRGFDGELAGGFERNPDLCRITSSVLSTIEGTPFIHWHLFDYVTINTIGLSYLERWKALGDKVDAIKHIDSVSASFLSVIPLLIVNNEEQLIQQHKAFVVMGYEGTVLRDLHGAYKQGRSTVIEGGFLRIKDFVIEEAIVTGILEGQANNNEKTINELGRSSRSSHKTNKVPNSLVGALICKDIKTSKVFKVAAGKMDHNSRKLYFDKPELILHETIKYKHFPKGVKDKPRFATFESIRISSDIEQK